MQAEPGGEGCVAGLVTGGRKTTESKENGANFGRGEPRRFGRRWAQSELGCVRKKQSPEPHFSTPLSETVRGVS